MAKKLKFIGVCIETRDLKMIDALARELRVSRSKLLVMGAFFFGGLHRCAKGLDRALIVEFEMMLARRSDKDSTQDPGQRGTRHPFIRRVL